MLFAIDKQYVTAVPWKNICMTKVKPSKCIWKGSLKFACSLFHPHTCILNFFFCANIKVNENLFKRMHIGIREHCGVSLIDSNDTWRTTIRCLVGYVIHNSQLPTHSRHSNCIITCNTWKPLKSSFQHVYTSVQFAVL